MIEALPSDLFARRLRQERERHGLSQAELARRIATRLQTNVDPSAVTRIEQQTRAVRLDEAVSAADSLGVPLTSLLSENPIERNEDELAKLATELTLALDQWHRSREQVVHLTQLIQDLTIERVEVDAHDQQTQADPEQIKPPLSDPPAADPSAPGSRQLL